MHFLPGYGDFPRLWTFSALRLCKVERDKVLRVASLFWLLPWSRLSGAFLLALLTIAFLLVVCLSTKALTAFTWTRLWASTSTGNSTQRLCN